MQAADTAISDPREIVTAGLIAAPRESVVRAVAGPWRRALVGIRWLSPNRGNGAHCPPLITSAPVDRRR